MEIRITHQGRVLADLEIFQDGQVQVKSLQQSAPAPQYVWGGQAASGPPPAAQYVWGGGGGGGVGAVGGPPPAAQYVWGAGGPSAAGPQGAAQYVWGSQGAGAPPAAQYVWGATNSRPGGLTQQAITVDCPAPVSHSGLECPSGTKVSEGLLPQTK